MLENLQTGDQEKSFVISDNFCCICDIKGPSRSRIYCCGVCFSFQLYLTAIRKHVQIEIHSLIFFTSPVYGLDMEMSLWYDVVCKLCQYISGLIGEQENWKNTAVSILSYFTCISLFACEVFKGFNVSEISVHYSIHFSIIF